MPIPTLDKFITLFDAGLRTVFAPAVAARPNPAAAQPEAALTSAQKKDVVGLMRINHVGEICAQALYEGQALTARNAEVKAALEGAAREETDHLAWCEGRINELGGRKSLLNPFWYGGAFTLGAVAGVLGDRWNLGFLAETEHQVEAHLDEHLDRLPADDGRSRAILAQMKEDEARHAQTALDHGGALLPAPVKLAMKLAARAMKHTAYWV